jgi:GNAT superfamily N-acetyltransferase
MSFTLRDLDPATDEAAALAFVAGSQAFEHPIEADRRLDAAVAGEWYAVLLERVAKGSGRIFIAERGGRPIGWGIFLVEVAPLYVVEELRREGFIVELYVVEDLRGQGVGQALIAACEDEARRLGLKRIMIGVLAGNRRAAEIYQRAGYTPYQLELAKFL